MTNEPGWKDNGWSGGDPFFIDAIDVWSYKWERVDRTIHVHDGYGQPRELDVYKITVGVKTITFASGEVSYGAYIFWVPETVELAE